MPVEYVERAALIGQPAEGEGARAGSLCSAGSCLWISAWRVSRSIAQRRVSLQRAMAMVSTRMRWVSVWGLCSQVRLPSNSSECLWFLFVKDNGFGEESVTEIVL